MWKSKFLSLSGIRHTKPCTGSACRLHRSNCLSKLTSSSFNGSTVHSQQRQLSPLAHRNKTIPGQGAAVGRRLCYSSVRKLLTTTLSTEPKSSSRILSSFFTSQHRHSSNKRKNRSRRTRSSVLKKQQEQNEENHASSGPPGTKSPFKSSTVTRFGIPDQEKEKRLAQIQNQVHDSYRSGSYKTGLKHAKAYLDACKKHFSNDDGPERNKYNHPAIASAHSDVGLFCKLLGDFDEARREYKAALKIYKKTVGRDHASYAGLLHNLGNLNRTQVHFDDELRTVDRITLMEEANESLEEAYLIRRDERGPEHPHTVASRSSWGASLAMQILQNYKLTSIKTSSSTSGSPQKPVQRYVAVQPIPSDQWLLAEQHLRLALETAIDTPRGPGLHQQQHQTLVTPKLPSMEEIGGESDTEEKKDYSRIQTLSAASAGQNLAIFLKTRGTTALPAITPVDEGDETTSASNNVKTPDENSSNHKQNSTTQEIASTQHPNDKYKEEDVVVKDNDKEDGGVQDNVEQDKKRNEDSLEEQDTPGVVEAPIRLRDELEAAERASIEQAHKWFEEAHELYLRVLEVRKAILPERHSDLYATQHSLAELLHVMGKTEEATALRQEIVDTFDPPDDKEGKNEGKDSKEEEN